MDHIETESLHLVRDKNFIDKYLNLMIRKELEIDINVSNEYVIAQNMYRQVKIRLHFCIGNKIKPPVL